MSVPNYGDSSIDRGQGAAFRSDRLTIGRSPPRLGIGSTRDQNNGIISGGSSLASRPPMPIEDSNSRIGYLPQNRDRDFDLINEAVTNRRMHSPPPIPAAPSDDLIRGRLEVLAQENARLQNAHVGLINQTNSMHSQLSMAVSQANLYSSSISQMERIIQDLEAQNASRVKTNATLNDKISELSTWNTVLRNDLQSARKEKEDAVTEACEMYEQLVSLQKDLSLTKSRLAAVERANKDLHTVASSQETNESELVSSLAEDVRTKTQLLQEASEEREGLSRLLAKAQEEKVVALNEQQSLKARIDRMMEDIERNQKDTVHRSQLSAIELSDSEKKFHYASYELNLQQKKSQELENERNLLALQLHTTSQLLAAADEERKRLSAELALSTKTKQEDEETKQRYLIDLENCKQQLHSLEEEKQKLHGEIAHLFEVNRNLQALSIEGATAIKRVREEYELKLGQVNVRLAAKETEICTLAQEALRDRLQQEESKKQLEDQYQKKLADLEKLNSALETKAVEGIYSSEIIER